MPLCTRFPRSTPLCTRFPRSTPLCTRFPRSASLHSLPSLHASLHSLPSLHASLHSLPSLHASLHSLPLLHATLHSLSSLHASLHSRPRFTPLCTPLPSLHASLHSLSSLHASLHLPYLPQPKHTHYGRASSFQIAHPNVPNPPVISNSSFCKFIPSDHLHTTQHLHPRNIDRTATKLHYLEIIVRTESVFPLPFNNKANPLSQLTISNEILGGMGNQISLFTNCLSTLHIFTTHSTAIKHGEEEEALPPPPKVGRKTQKDECTKIGQCRKKDKEDKEEEVEKRKTVEVQDRSETLEPPEAHQPHLEAGTISEPLSDIQEESQNEKIPRDWDSYGDTIAETNKAQEEKEKTLVKEAKTELKEENDQLTRNEDTKETTIDSDTQPYHPLNNLSNLLPAILPRTEAEQDIIIDCVEWSLARFDCHSVTTVQTVNRHSLARLISFTRHSLLELPEVKGMGMADELEWLCRVEFIFDLCEAVSKAKDESGTLEADLVDIKPQHTQTRLDAEQLRQDEWEIVVKSILHTHTFPTSEAPNWKCASFS
ncbi:hypothetical protein BLNAU_10974 [Blattamonas nauphoetae]|uniref:Uncharacterized protein n=1 Tax=Blattamonas nauphoetae TaxID=2049346 RepID=A0ABQ9XP13_9EUKA|nr:hypothetical protein BLNAU_10974 [Blattamonas nauphoetae]